jgi:putative FmdB family regulatory protein
MPTYEYQCQKCKRRHEAFQSITAKPLTKCPRPVGRQRRGGPRCGGRLKRLLGSGSGFLFKGSGFYITDYRSKSYHDAKRKDQPSTSSTSSSSESKKP